MRHHVHGMLVDAMGQEVANVTYSFDAPDDAAAQELAQLLTQSTELRLDIQEIEDEHS